MRSSSNISCSCCQTWSCRDVSREQTNINQLRSRCINPKNVVSKRFSQFFPVMTGYIAHYTRSTAWWVLMWISYFYESSDLKMLSVFSTTWPNVCICDRRINFLSCFWRKFLFFHLFISAHNLLFPKSQIQFKTRLRWYLIWSLWKQIMATPFSGIAIENLLHLMLSSLQLPPGPP